MSKSNIFDTENISIDEPITEHDRELIANFKKLPHDEQVFRFSEIKRAARLTEQKKQQKQKYLIGTRAYA